MVNRSLICRIFGHARTMIVDAYSDDPLSDRLVVVKMHPGCKRCGRRLPELP